MILNEKHKANIIQIIKDNLKIESEVIAYGSRIRGDCHDASDLDIIIKTKSGNPLPKEDFRIITKKFQESNIPIIIDLRDWALVPKYFHKYINEQNELLYRNY